MEELGGREAAQGFEPPGVCIGIHEGPEVHPELVAGIVVVAFDGRVLDGAVHPFDLPNGPRVDNLGEPWFEIALVAHAIEDVLAVPGPFLRAASRSAGLAPLASDNVPAMLILTGRVEALRGVSLVADRVVG